MSEEIGTVPKSNGLGGRTYELHGSGEVDLPGLGKEEVLALLKNLRARELELQRQGEELSRLRRELELARSMSSELYDLAPVGYFSFSSAGTVLSVNQTGANLLGVERGELLQRDFAEFLVEEDRQIFRNHITWVLQKHSMLRCEIRLKGEEGSQVRGQLQSVAVSPADRHSGMVFSSIVDVTVRRQLEEMLQQANEELESRVVRRSEELSRANQQLSREIEERHRSDDSLQRAYGEIKVLRDRLQAENIYLQQDLDREYNFGEIIGRSAALDYVFFRIQQVAPQDTTVLLLGETGTGKGVVARAIHSRSSRKNRPMVTVHCTSLPANLIESELFGREKGAFTGSTDRQIGRFELADGGTIFLDEIGEMPMELQTKLLRVIQDGEFERLGSPRTIKVNVRIIAATNRSLEEEIRNGRFREDLFYRLNVFPITVPPLRKRKEDIPLLVNYFVAKFCKKTGRCVETVSKETLNTLQAYHWPGNVRELESVIERAVITSPGTSLQLLDRLENTVHPHVDDGRDVKGLVELEREHILQVLKKTGWRIEGSAGAAVLLGLNPSTLRGRMRKYGIKRT